MLEEILKYIIDNFLAIAALIIAALSLYLHYRRPPERLEIRRRHSDELKEEIKRWISRLVIPNPEVREQTTIAINSGKEKTDLDLFDDIINHVPKDLSNLITKSKDLEKRKEEYLRRKASLSSRVKEEISANVVEEFKFASYTGLLHEIVYYEAFALARGQMYVKGLDVKIEKSGDVYQIWIGGFGTLKGSKKELEENVGSVMNYIMKRAEDYKSDAKELLWEYEFLTQLAGEVSGMLKEMLRIPILPGECKYLKYARSKAKLRRK